VTCRFFHRIYKEHERRIRGFLEPEPCILFKNNRGNRTKIFPVLDLVQSSLHSGIEGRGEYRTTSQGPGSKLHPPLKPTNNFIVGKQTRCLNAHIIHLPIGNLCPLEKPLHSGIVIVRSPVNVIHYELTGRSIPFMGVNPKGSSQGRSRITGGGLHPDILKRSTIAQPCVQNTI